MPRPVKCRRVCCLPVNRAFFPASPVENGTVVTLSIDEYETIRLIDREGLSQEECGVSMQIARTTVQQIYNAARKKLASVLVDGAVLRIEGGEYQLCDAQESTCTCPGCRRRRHLCPAAETDETQKSEKETES